MKRGGGLLLLFFSLGLTVGVWGGESLRTPQVQTAEPPLALGPEPQDPDERVGWIERIVERRMVRALEVDPDAKTGPVVDVLAVKLAQWVRKLIGVAIGLAVTAAVVAFLWANWPWAVGFVAVQTALSWLAGRLGSKK